MSSTDNVLRDDLVLLGYNANDAEDVLRALANILYRAGAVKDTYFEALLEREREFPTGLPTEGVKVALPHADVEHVNYSALAIATLAHPVTFREMGNPDNELAVEVVLMLANADPKEQVKTIRRLVDMFDEPEILHTLKTAETSAEVISLIGIGHNHEQT
jgi:PTS system galactitol-specific IIA component